jgi:cell division protein FtsW
MNAVLSAEQGLRRQRLTEPLLDQPLALGALLLLGVGLVMIASASIGIADRLTGDPFHYFYRQGAFALVGLLLALATLKTPLAVWERGGPALLFVTAVLLIALYLPGFGRTVNGSTRWLELGPVALQVSELLKLAVIVYMAGYLVRRGDAVRATVAGFLKPMAIVALFALLLLAQPDFGAAAVITATVMGMMFLGGVRLWLFGVLLALAGGAMTLLAVSTPYRLQRITGFLDPWQDPFNSGFQLTQALIAFGRGDWFGVGLGGSVQKLFYLPEAHTDFVFAVLGEELGLAGTAGAILLFTFVVTRMFRIGRRALLAERAFAAHLSFGLALWFGMQAFINMGVNMGVLPTKGLTLPLVSYGGSSMLVNCIAVALVLRAGIETRLDGAAGGRP